jgi:hypothetical protein
MPPRQRSGNSPGGQQQLPPQQVPPEQQAAPFVKDELEIETALKCVLVEMGRDAQGNPLNTSSSSSSSRKNPSPNRSNIRQTPLSAEEKKTVFSAFQEAKEQEYRELPDYWRFQVNGAVDCYQLTTDKVNLQVVGPTVNMATTQTKQLERLHMCLSKGMDDG